MSDVRAELRSLVERYRDDPVGFVANELRAEPDGWQVDALHSVRDNQRTALVACKGPGKSSVLAWAGWWLLATHTDAQGIALSITADNLADNLWKELAYWQRNSALLRGAFDLGGERIVSREPDHARTWWLSARSFAKQADKDQQANTLAGLHARVVFALLDEFGDYPDGVLPATEGIFANDVLARAIVAGNPTRTGGSLHQVAARKSWHVINITGDPDEPKRSKRISIEWAQQQIAEWGRENPWVMANVLGQFPPSSTDKLIPLEAVLAAMDRDLPRLAYQADPIIWGLDPARFGDDESALARRQGVLVRTFKGCTWRNLDGVQLAGRVATKIHEAKGAGDEPDAIFVDVVGVGASAYDHLCFLGFRSLVHGVEAGGAPRSRRFADKRTETWWDMATWAKRSSSCLPNDPVLRGELVEPFYDYRILHKQTVLKLESKKEMKARGVASPNRADALSLTFAEPMAAVGRRAQEAAAPSSKAVVEYDPYA